jgi:O-antigen/teichoic acid export membrane protein
MAETNLVEEFRKSGGLSRSVIHALFFRLAGLGLIFLLQVMLARCMGPSHYGDYTVIMTTLNLILVFSVFGFDSSILRFIPSYISRKEYAYANGFVKFSYQVITVLSLACSIGLFIFLLSKSKKFNISFSEGFFWGVILIPFLAFMYQANAVLRSLNKIKTSLLSVYFLSPVLIGLTCLYYYSSHNRLTVDAAMFINLGCSAAICIFINRRAGKVLKEQSYADQNLYERKKWLSVSSILFLTTALDLLLRQSDILMVSYFLGNTKAGYYAVSAKLALLASLGLSVADYVFMPKIAALFESRQLMKLQQFIRNSSLQILSITLPISFILFVGGKWILGFFGEAFHVSYLPLVILLCGQIINAMTGMVSGLMTMTGYQKTFFTFYFLAFLIQFFLNIILIPSIGITGAAIGSSLAMIFLNLAAYTFVKRKLKIKASFF